MKYIIFGMLILPLCFWKHIFLILFFTYLIEKINLKGKSKETRYQREFYYLFSVMLFIGILTGIFKFNFIPQARRLLETKDDLFYWFKSGHVHAIRLLIAYPAVIMHKFYDLPLNTAFSIYVGFVFCEIHLKCQRILSIYNKTGQFQQIMIAMVNIGLAFVMNGRVVFSFYGYIMIICFFAELNIKKKSITIRNIIKDVFIPFIFTMVSSGTMIIAILYIIFAFWFTYKGLSNKNIKKKMKKKMVCSLIFLLPLVVYFAGYIYEMVEKNIQFFGGGIQGLLNMTQHGLGKILGLVKIGLGGMLFIGIIIFMFIFLCLQKIQKKGRFAVLPLASCIGGAGMVFGFSAGSMILLPIILLFLISVGTKRGKAMELLL